MENLNTSDIDNVTKKICEKIRNLFQRFSGFAAKYPFLTITVVMLLANVVAIFPVLSSHGNKFFQFYDGPFYLVVAKTFYTLTDAEAAMVSWVPRNYYACHLPMYPFLIRLLSYFTANYEWAMTVATTASATFSALLFYKLLKRGNYVKYPLFSAIMFCIFPARWVIYHSASASEPLFLCFTFLTFIDFHERKTGRMTFWILLASLTRIVGVLLGISLFLTLLLKKEIRRSLIIPLSGVGLFGLFAFFKLQYNDFFAYFSHNLYKEQLVRWPPALSLLSVSGSANFHSAEVYLTIYLVIIAGMLCLYRYQELFIYALINVVFVLHIYHVDVLRYTLPIMPFVFFVGFDAIWREKAMRVFAILALPLILIYVWNYVPKNIMPADWFMRISTFVNGQR